MRTLFSLFWKTAGIAAVLGVATMVHRDAQPSPEGPSEPTGPVPAGPDAALSPGAHPEHAVVLKPGWSRALPEKIPNPTYWPALFAFGLMFVAWGLISNLFLFGIGVIMAVIAVVGWVYDLRHEYPS
jgi:hypothetical protein